MISTVACVLRSGGRYTPEWVRKLRRGLLEHWPERAPLLDFVCLTDVPLHLYGVREMPLACGFPGWWSKLEALRLDVPTLLLDLDTLVVGDPSDLLSYPGEFGMMTGFYRDICQSAVMAWRPGALSSEAWERFINAPADAMASERGDGEWLHAQLGDRADRLMALYPGRIVSLKLHAQDGPPEGACLVCAHGDGKFDEPVAGWAHEAWMAL